MTKSEKRLVLSALAVLVAGMLLFSLHRHRFYADFLAIPVSEGRAVNKHGEAHAPGDVHRSAPGRSDRQPGLSETGVRTDTASLEARTGGSETPESAVRPSSLPSDTGEGSSTGRTDINRAGMDDLVALPGIGRVTALGIIEYRTRTGGFSSVEELLEVKGIGPKKLELLRSLVEAR